MAALRVLRKRSTDASITRNHPHEKHVYRRLKPADVVEQQALADGNAQDTADAMDIPTGTVRSRLSRAREQLKRATYNPLQP
jgi:DNA-directed RNA polymerase specialized sigma24 family protein